jgi:hypothetical protein
VCWWMVNPAPCLCSYVSQTVSWVQCEVVQSRGVDNERLPSAATQGTWYISSIGATTYMYFIKTSNASVPPGAPYMRLSIGDMSDWRMDWRISITAARWTSCVVRPVSLVSLSLSRCNVCGRDPVVGSPTPEPRSRLGHYADPHMERHWHLVSLQWPWW